MADLGALAQELREALQQQQAVTTRLLALCDALEQEAIEKGQSGVLCPYDEIVREWNDRCASQGMKRRNTAGELKAAILRVWRKHPNLDRWRAAFDACSRSGWWRGEGGWQGSLESFVRPTHYGKWFDEGLAAAPPAKAPAERGLAFGDDAPVVDTVEEEVRALLADKTRRLPIEGLKDPREVRGKDDREFVRRLDLLKTRLREDWRFAAS